MRFPTLPCFLSRRNGSMGGRQKPLIEDPLVELPASMRAALSSGDNMNTDEEVLSNDMAHTRAMPGGPSSSSLSVGLSRAPPRVCTMPTPHPLRSHACLPAHINLQVLDASSASYSQQGRAMTFRS